MDISVKNTMRYKEIIIRDGGATIESGLLDDCEARDMASTFIQAADSLVSGDIFVNILEDVGINYKNCREKVNYYTQLIKYLEDMIPNLDEVIEQFEEEQ